MSLAANTKRGPSADSRADEDRLDRLAINTIRTLCDGCRAEGQFRPSRHADGAGAGRLHAVAANSCATIPPIRTGPTATASCSPAATPRCCSIRCCISPACKRSTARRAAGRAAVTLDDIKQFRQLDSACPGHPEYRCDLGRRDHDRAARPGLRQQRRHGDGATLAGRPLQPARLRAVRLRRLRAVQRRRHDGGRLQRGRVARRPSEARRTSAGSTTTTTSRSRATPTSPSARTSATRFRAYGWHVLHVADANDRDALARGARTVPRRPTTGRR